LFQTKLLEVADAIDLVGLLFSPGECWQEQRRQNGDNRDHDEKFD